MKKYNFSLFSPCSIFSLNQVGIGINTELINNDFSTEFLTSQLKTKVNLWTIIRELIGHIVNLKSKISDLITIVNIAESLSYYSDKFLRSYFLIYNTFILRKQLGFIQV